MRAFERKLSRPRKYQWLDRASKGGYIVGLPLLLFSAFVSDWTVRIWIMVIGAAAFFLGLVSMFIRDIYMGVAVLFILSPYLAAIVNVTDGKEISSPVLWLTAPFFAIGVLMLLRWLHAIRSPNKPVQHNAGSRPFSNDSPASETPSSLGPRG